VLASRSIPVYPVTIDNILWVDLLVDLLADFMLTVVKIKSLTKRGRYGDGRGLWLQVDGDRKSWLYRFMLNGRARSMGLGPYPEVSLAEARDKALECRRLCVRGIDPIEARKGDRASQKTFQQCAEEFIQSHKAGWSNAKQVRQWTQSLTDYAFPVFGSLPVGAVDTSLVMKAVQPIWTEKAETASRVRGRIENILDWAKTHGYRVGENPARWRGHLENLLPSHAKVRKIEHFAAIPYSEMPNFLADLREEGSVFARALEFLILTAARSGEVLGATWPEINLEQRVWIIPAARMKAGREHRVPLSDAALALLHRGEGFVFGNRRKPIAGMSLRTLLQRMGREATIHGFRSSFRDWAAEQTDFPSEVVEMALAHVVGNKVETAYRRTDLFDRRRELMNAWAQFCSSEI
jgi:integrase